MNPIRILGPLTATTLALLPPAVVCAHAAAAPPVPPPIRDMVGLDQHPGAPLPLEASFRDASGRAVTLGDVLHDRPAVLMFGYFSCTQLCGVTLDGTLDALRQLRPTVGRDYDVVYVSIDPGDAVPAAAAKRTQYIRQYGRGGSAAGWHFLTGEPAGIAAVTGAAGFRYQRIAGTSQFAHPSGFLVVRGDGVIARYFPGVDFRPAEIAQALRDARAGHIGAKVFDLLLVCFSGGLQPGVGRTAFFILQIACGVTVLGLGAGIGFMLRQERRPAGAPRGKGRR